MTEEETFRHGTLNAFYSASAYIRSARFPCKFIAEGGSCSWSSKSNCISSFAGESGT